MRLFVLIAVLSLASATVYAQDTSSSAWPASRARAWVAKGEWKKGLTPKPHASVNPVDFAVQYHRNPALWDKVFAFMRTQDLEHMAPGKYPIDGDNAYAMISQGRTKLMDSVKWESHRQYIDLHYVIAGKEKIGVAPIGKATVTEPFTDKSDNAHYTATGPFYVAEPGTFFLFFPHDLHRPGIAVPGTPEDKKLVIKIKVTN